MTSRLTVVHEDARLIACDKPCGVPVIPGRGPAAGEPLVEAASRHLGGKAYIVHRLDAATSGLVIFGKDPESHRRLCLLFEERRVRKSYRAAVAGTVEKDGEIDRPLRAYGSGRMGVAPDGKPSRTRYGVLERLQDATLLELFPETGRRHQLRAHLFSIGHPVLGDGLYGHDRPVGGAGRLMLHARTLAFDLDGPVDLEAPPGPDFESVLSSLRA